MVILSILDNCAGVKVNTFCLRNPYQSIPNTPPAATTPLNFDEELVRITGGSVKTPDELTALLQKANKTLMSLVEQVKKATALLQAKSKKQ